MATLSLHQFIGANRDELIRRCREKVTKRLGPTASKESVDHGIPLFLDQLLKELRDSASQTRQIANSAGHSGHTLLLQGVSLSEVVHGYGDVCQPVTELAVQMDAAISADDFRTMNRCLDDAIAAAVTQYAADQAATSDGEASELRLLTHMAITAFDMLQMGNVGVSGTTAGVLRRSLMGICAVIDRPRVKTTEQQVAATSVEHIRQT